MKRFHLKLEDLAVETFAVTPAGDRRIGTVFGNEESLETESDWCGGDVSPTCVGGAGSCVNTCDFTCANTCKWTCDDNTCIPNTECWSGPCMCASGLC